MFQPKSDYARNKLDPNAIVYKDAKNVLNRLTRDSFSSEEEFQKWKKISDSNYHEQENGQHNYADHNLSLEELPEAALAIPSVENQLTAAIEAELTGEASLYCRLREILTPVQLRRIWQYALLGKTQEQIARQEGVGQPRIWKSLQQVRARLEHSDYFFKLIKQKKDRG